MDIRPEIEIEVPDGLKGPELVQWLHDEYHDLFKRNFEAKNHMEIIEKQNKKAAKVDKKQSGRQDALADFGDADEINII